MTPPLPKSPLFPYTTLFRSREDGAQVRQAGQHAGRGQPDEGGGDVGGLDRKSTRLNSSHANISYAVFCLKKKTTVTSALFRGTHGLRYHLRAHHDSLSIRTA